MSERWHKDTSGSCAGTHFHCAPSGGAFPRANTSGEWADRGNQIHDFCRVTSLALSLDDPAEREAVRVRALSKVDDEYKATCEGINIGEVLDGLTVLGAEEAFAVNVLERTARHIGTNIGRDYVGELARKGLPPLEAYEIPLSIDIVARAETGVIVELDWKSGRHLGSPEDNWQRRLCSMALMFYYGEDEAISRVGYIWDDGRVQPDGCEFTAIDAAVYCDEAVAGLNRVWVAMQEMKAGKIPQVFPSDDGCKYCASFFCCPYWTTFAKNMAGTLDGLPTAESIAAGAIDVSTLTSVYETWKHAEKIFKVLEPALKGVAAVTPIPLGPDHEYREGEGSRTSFDDALARGLLIRLGASPEQMAELNRKVTFPTFSRRKRILPVIQGEEPPKPKKERKKRTPKVVETPLTEQTS